MKKATRPSTTKKAEITKIVDSSGFSCDADNSIDSCDSALLDVVVDVVVDFVVLVVVVIVVVVGIWSKKFRTKLSILILLFKIYNVFEFTKTLSMSSNFFTSPIEMKTLLNTFVKFN